MQRIERLFCSDSSLVVDTGDGWKERKEDQIKRGENEFRSQLMEGE